MSSDKRSVATDALETLGTIIGEGAGRDAIHLAVEPMVAAVKLYPGQDVGIQGGLAGPSTSPLGIVDPFLKAPVQQGERFWLVVYPRQITSLRHVWTHPAFQEGAPAQLSTEDSRKSRSEVWLRAWCGNTGDAPDYDTLLRLAEGVSTVVGYTGWSNEGEYLLCHGSDAYGQIPAELWDHVENVTGKKIGDDNRAKSFSCTC